VLGSLSLNLIHYICFTAASNMSAAAYRSSKNSLARGDCILLRRVNNFIDSSSVRKKDYNPFSLYPSITILRCPFFIALHFM